jgi:hypothetical protein
MKKLLLFSCLFLAVACHTTKHSTTPAGGQQARANAQQADGSQTSSSKEDGSSYSNAVIIKEKSEGPGVDAEYKWIRDHYPGSKTKSQALQMNNGKSYDVLTIVTADGAEKRVYFDISNFFGKF